MEAFFVFLPCEFGSLEFSVTHTFSVAVKPDGQRKRRRP